MSDQLRFTGGDNLTGFTKMMNDVLMKNELKDGVGAYEISHAKGGRSGWSYGPPQWDLSKGETAYKTIFNDILVNAKDSAGHNILTSAEAQTLFNAATTNGTLLDGDQTKDQCGSSQ